MVVDFDGARVKVATSMTPWPQMPIRRASVNSLGYGGANAHCVLDHVSSFVPGYQLGGQKRYRLAVNGQDHTTASPAISNTGCSVMARELTNKVANGIKHGSNKPIHSGRYPILQNPMRLRSLSNAETRRLVLLPVSGHDEHSLKGNISTTANIISDYNLADLAYTLSARRSRYFHRGYALLDASTPNNALDVDAITCGKASSSQLQRIGFVFTGM